jgi:hypothetical protein
MSRLSILAVLLALSPSVVAADAASPAANAPNYGDAMRAYYAKDYATCATILADLLKVPGPRTSAMAYNAACCLALDGRADAAFKSLEQAITADVVSVKDLDSDADLQLLRSNAAWPAFRAHAVQLEESRLSGIDRALRDELLKRRDEDQTVRNKLISPGGLDPVLVKEVARIDHDNTEWMKQVLATYGWPGKSMVLKDGANAAFLFVQHADMDPPFQKQALELMKAAVAKGEAEGTDLAYLTDRILVGEGKPQLYGTQFHNVDGKLVPQPIEDEANVDILRALVGLPSLVEYRKVMQQQFGDAEPTKTK